MSRKSAFRRFRARLISLAEADQGVSYFIKEIIFRTSVSQCEMVGEHPLSPLFNCKENVMEVTRVSSTKANRE